MNRFAKALLNLPRSELALIDSDAFRRLIAYQVHGICVTVDHTILVGFDCGDQLAAPIGIDEGSQWGVDSAGGGRVLQFVGNPTVLP